jgi:MFS transporter, ACS family, solute carrier family 17 (sodium-dependent inorganic phosphate cotransporter), other
LHDRVSNSSGTLRWPKRYTLISLCFCAAFICYIDRVNISVAILAMQDRFGWSETEKGFILASFFVGYMIFQVPSGYFANRFGGKRVLGGAVIWWSLCTILTPIAAAASFPVLIAARIAMGMGEATMFPGAYSLFGRWVPQSERARAVALLLSGIPLGTLFALSVSGWIILRWGWEAVFYLFGAAGAIWALVWFSLAHDGPQSHPRISPEERQLLQENGARRPEATRVPWKKLLSMPPVWALVVNHFCSNWNLYLLLTWLPSYFRNVQGLSIAKAGIFSAAPWLTMFLMTNVAAWIADTMVRRGATVTFVRKLMQSIGLLGSSAFLLLAIEAASPSEALLLMCGALGTLAFTWSGYAPNHLDIAPRYADVLMGLTNTAGTIPGIVGVAVTGWLVDTTGSYSSAFILAASVSAFGALVWIAFGTGKRLVD